MKAVQRVDETHSYVELVPEDDDFLAYWKTRPEAKVETKRILGVEVAVPHDVPLSFLDDLAELKNSTDPEDTKRLLLTLFGDNPLDTWVRNGATADQLQVILAWGIRNAQGTPTTFAEAADLVEQARALEAAGKAPAPVPNRAARRASSRTRASASTGR